MTSAVSTRVPERPTRLVSLLTLMGTVAVVVAFLVAGNELRDTTARLKDLRNEAERLLAQNRELANQSDSLKKAVEGLREALTAARAGINAYHAGDYLGAVALYDIVIRGDSTNAYLLNLRAYSLFKAGRIADAVRGQELSLRADSTYSWGYFDLARFQCASGQWEPAKAAIRRLLLLAPGMRDTMNRDVEFRRYCRPIYP